MGMNTGACTVATGSIPADKTFPSLSFGKILHSLSAHIAVINRSGRIITVNDSWTSFTANYGTGQTAAGIGSNYLEIFGTLQHPECFDWRQKAQQGIERVFRGEIDEFELEFANLTTADSHWYLMRCTPMEDGEHAVICHLDITALKRSADRRSQRAQQLEYLHRIQRAASSRLELEPMIQATLSQLFHILQPDLAMLFLFDDDTLVLKESLPRLTEGFFQFSAPPSIGQCLCGLAVKQQAPVFSTDIIADSRCSKHECRCAGYRSFGALPLLQDNRILGCIGIASKHPRDFSVHGPFLESAVEDITTALNNALAYSRLQAFTANIGAQMEERQRTEQAHLQRRKQEAIAHLAGGIAHDFNNILAAIMGYSELVLKKEIDSEAREYVEGVLKASHRAKDLVQQILTFSRKKDAGLMPMDLRTLLNESLPPLRSSLPDNVTLSSYLDDLPEAAIRGNPSQLQQVFRNLSANSLQAMKSSGGNLKVTLRAATADRPLCARCPELEEGRNYAELSIQDTGTGIPTEYLDSIFEPYFTTRVPERGTGLGLAVVHGIIRRHGGDVLVESIPGISTTFTVYLPLFNHASASCCSDGITKQRQQPAHILIVDDDEPILHVMRMTLESNGYTVTTSQFAKEAMTLFSSSPDTYDLVLCDLSMPDIGGEILARKMKTLRHEIPVILCSGHSAELLRGIDTSHIDKILEKPIPRAELLRSLKEKLGGS